jgi:hypothetical protein
VVIVCLNNAEVEVDSRDHEDIDRNEKEESQTFAIFPQRSRAHEAPGTPAKVYKRRVTNQRLRTSFEVPANMAKNARQNGCATLMQQLAEGLATDPCLGHIAKQDKSVLSN